LDRAKSEYAEQLEAFTDFSAQQAARVPHWRKMVEDFEKDPNAKNPYEMAVHGTWGSSLSLRAIVNALWQA
jgi:hypothetical protein